MRKAAPSLGITLLSLAACLTVLTGEEQAGKPEAGKLYSLEAFGPVGTPAEADAALKKAIGAAVAKGGGIVHIPAAVPHTWSVENLHQGTLADFVNPETSARVRDHATVTIVDARGGFLNIHVPPVEGPGGGGVTITRNLRMPVGHGLNHWDKHPAVEVRNNIISGSDSYIQPVMRAVEKGENRRFYVDTIRGIRVGCFLNAHGGPGYQPPVSRIRVKDLGWDKELRKAYFVADTENDHKAPAHERTVGGFMNNKNNVGAVGIQVNANADEQTYDLNVIRKQYGLGDTFMISGMYFYQSNIHSTLGDENGHVFNAETISDLRLFNSKVESMDWSTRTLTYAPGAVNAFALGMSRPIVNLNEEKWITQGTVLIVPPDEWWYPKPEDEERKYKFEGKAYPSKVVRGMRFGGMIRSSEDAPWTEDVIGRWFAVDEPSERLERNDRSTGGGYERKHRATVRRWYEIRDFKRNPDGTKEIRLLRVFWYANSAGAPRLYDHDNYTWDGHVRPLKYIIAPGAYVSDVSEGWHDNEKRGGRVGAHESRVVRLAPNGDVGTSFDFQPGDPVEQAVGSDPFTPTGLRLRHFDSIPGCRPSTSISIHSSGRVAMDAGITFYGVAKRLEDLERRKDKRPSYGSMIDVQSMVDVGLDFKNDVGRAVMLMHQPNGRAQPIQWHYAEGAKTASLEVSPETGDLEFKGGNLSAGGAGVIKTSGISATEKPARNLRGVGIQVAAGLRSIEVSFPRPEADGEYAVFIEQSWLSNRAIAKKEKEGFTVQFQEPAPENATLDWMIVR